MSRHSFRTALGRIYSLYHLKSQERRSYNAFKLTNRLIHCGRYLNLIKNRNSPLCSVCKEEDSLVHFFLSCTPVCTFWEGLSKWCERYLGFLLSHLDKTEYLQGKTKQAKNKRVTSIPSIGSPTTGIPCRNQILTNQRKNGLPHDEQGKILYLLESAPYRSLLICFTVTRVRTSLPFSYCSVSGRPFQGMPWREMAFI